MILNPIPHIKSLLTPTNYIETVRLRREALIKERDYYFEVTIKVKLEAELLIAEINILDKWLIVYNSTNLMKGSQ